MKFLKPSWKKVLLTILLFGVFAYVAMQFGTQAFTYSDENTTPNPPIHFKLNPVLWLPAWYLLKGEVVEFTILKSFLYTLPYWLAISYLFSCIIFKNDHKNSGTRTTKLQTP